MLAEVLAIAEKSGELQRLALVGCALSELAWLPAPATAAGTAHGLRDGADRRFAMGTRRAGPLDGPGGLAAGPVPTRVAEPFALEIAGRWVDAAASWAELGCRYDEALALAESKDPELVARALRQLTDLGASATATHLDTAVGFTRRPVATAATRQPPPPIRPG